MDFEASEVTDMDDIRAAEPLKGEQYDALKQAVDDFMASFSETDPFGPDTYLKLMQPAQLMLQPCAIGCEQYMLSAQYDAARNSVFCRTMFRYTDAYINKLQEVVRKYGKRHFLNIRSRVASVAYRPLQRNELAKKLSILKSDALKRVAPMSLETRKYLEGLLKSITIRYDDEHVAKYINEHKDSSIIPRLHYENLDLGQFKKFLEYYITKVPVLLENLSRYGAKPFNLGLRARTMPISKGTFQYMMDTGFESSYDDSFEVEVTRIVAFHVAVSTINLVWPDKSEQMKEIIKQFAGYLGLRIDRIISPLLTGAKAYQQVVDLKAKGYRFLPYDGKKFETIVTYLTGFRLLSFAEMEASGQAFTSLLNTLCSLYLVSLIGEKVKGDTYVAVMGDDVLFLTKDLLRNDISKALPSDLFEFQDTDFEAEYYLGFSTYPNLRLIGVRNTKESAKSGEPQKFDQFKEHTYTFYRDQFDPVAEEAYLSMYTERLLDRPIYDVMAALDLSKLDFISPTTVWEKLLSTAKGGEDIEIKSEATPSEPPKGLKPDDPTKSDILHFHDGDKVTCLNCAKKSKKDFDAQREVTPDKYRKSNPNHADWNKAWGPIPACSHFKKPIPEKQPEAVTPGTPGKTEETGKP